MDVVPGPFSAAAIASLEAVAVVNIDSPTELNSLAGSINGERRVCYQVIANDNVYTVYYWDSADGSGASSPYVMAGSSGYWIACAGKYVNSAVLLRSTISVAGIASFTNTTAGSAVGTAAVVLSGGLSAAKASYFGGNVTMTNASVPTLTLFDTTTAASSWAIKHLANGNLQIVQPSQNTWLTLTHSNGKITSLGPIVTTDGTASTTVNTGALVVGSAGSGGLGVNGAINGGDNITSLGNGNTRRIGFNFFAADVWGLYIDGTTDSAKMHFRFGTSNYANFDSTGAFNSTQGDATIGVRVAGATGRLRIRGYVDATQGCVVESTNTAESLYLPMTFGSTAYRFLSGGVTSFLDTTDASDSATAAVVVSGGAAMAKNLWVGANAAAGIALYLNCAAANGGVVKFMSANTLRWQMGRVGSTHDWRIEGYNSSGVLTDIPLTIANAAAGAFTIARPLTVGGTAANAFIDVSTSTNGNQRAIRFIDTAGSKYNWLTGAQVTVSDAYQIIPSTAAGGSTYSTPALNIAAATGVVTIPAGVNFGGTTLSVYDEGTFTPTIAGATTAGTANYTIQTGRYVKIGHLVSVHFSLEWNTHTGTGNLTITSLPFTSVGTTFSGGSLAIMEGFTAPDGVSLRLDPVKTFMYVTKYVSGGTGTVEAIIATGRLDGSITYYSS